MNFFLSGGLLFLAKKALEFSFDSVHLVSEPDNERISVDLIGMLTGALLAGGLIVFAAKLTADAI